MAYKESWHSKTAIPLMSYKPPQPFRICPIVSVLQVIIQRLPMRHTASTCRLSDKKHGVDAPIILRVVCHLGILAPDHLAAWCHKPQLAHIHLQQKYYMST